MARQKILVFLGALTLPLAAAAQDEAPLGLTITNKSQFELLEIKIHDDFAYLEVSDILDGPLGIEESILVDFAAGQYVTVIREKVANGDTLAITTAEPLDVPTSGGALLVFDDSFRLIAPPTANAAGGGCGCTGAHQPSPVFALVGLTFAAIMAARRRRQY